MAGELTVPWLQVSVDFIVIVNKRKAATDLLHDVPDVHSSIDALSNANGLWSPTGQRVFL
jgi:hypothetical protein